MPRLLYRFFLLLSVFAGTSLPLSAQGYSVQAGDVLRIEVLQDEELNRTVLVAPDGRITFPLAGSLNARGRSLGAIQTDLVERLQPNFEAQPTVLVSLERVAPPEPEDPVFPTEPTPPPTVAIYAIGEVANSGRIELEPGTRLLQAFAQIGGFSDFAAQKRIQLRRFDHVSGQERIYPLNYEAIMAGRSPNAQVIMQEGDVILVPTRRLFE